MSSFFTSFTKIFGNKYKKDIQSINPIIEKTKKEFSSLNDLSNDELREKTKKFTEQDAVLIADAEKTIEMVVQLYSNSGTQIIESAGQLEEESQSVKVAIEEVIVSLQFQDRVSQILDQINNNMNELSPHVEQCINDISNGTNNKGVDKTQWLSKFKSTYTTVEQVSLHDNSSAKVQQADESEITFF